MSKYLVLQTTLASEASFFESSYTGKLIVKTLKIIDILESESTKVQNDVLCSVYQYLFK